MLGGYRLLANLHVKNLAIIDEIEIDFTKHLNILTGETGAGKSIIIGSINIALGGKVPHDIIRKGADYGLVELVFQVEDPSIEEIMRTGIIGFHGITTLGMSITFEISI